MGNAERPSKFAVCEKFFEIFLHGNKPTISMSLSLVDPVAIICQSIFLVLNCRDKYEIFHLGGNFFILTGIYLKGGEHGRAFG